MVNVLQLSERAKSGSHDFKMAILAWKTQNVLEDDELEALLDEDCCQTQEELAESSGVTQLAILKLKAAGYIAKQGYWVP